MKIGQVGTRALELIGAFALAATHAVAAAQSGSLGYGKPSSEGPRAVEEQSAAISYSSRATACALAKSSASEYAKRKPNLKDMSLGSCECSIGKKALWLPQQQARYRIETGQSIDSITPVEVHECTVTARLVFK